ncbi:pPIWI_RE module domain-containing protein [Nocardiopsis nanhaiensis]
MVSYKAIQPAAFIHSPDADPLYHHFHTISFPAQWREAVLGLYADSVPEKRRDKVLQRRRVPIRRLDRLMRAAAPNLVATGRDASIDDETPWLYANTPYPPAVLRGFLSAWLRDMFDPRHDGRGEPDAESYRRIRQSMRILDTSDLQWELNGVDLTSQELSDGGTSVPDPRLFRLLPEHLADKIAAFSEESPYEHGGERLRFRRAAGLIDTEAELISWPPLRFTKKSGHVAHRYSAYIRLSLRTSPFSPIPRIHMATGIRRWVSSKVTMKGVQAASVYLLADSSLVPDGPVPERFAVADIAWNRHTRQVEWREGGPGGMLTRISMLDALPPADVLRKDAADWIDGQGGLSLAVTHHTTMGSHGVKAGLMPEERRRLVEWAGQALAPQLTPVAPLKKSTVSKRNPAAELEQTRSIRKAASPEERQDVEAENERISARNAARYRARAATALGEEGLGKQALSAVVFHQSTVMRDHLLQAAENHLGLAPYRQRSGPDEWVWSTPELEVYVKVTDLGELGAPLGGEHESLSRKKMEEAIAARRAEATAKMQEVLGSTNDVEVPFLSFVELEGPFRPSTFKGFRPRNDPKGALRLGFADAGLVSQFFRPLDREVKEDKRDQDAAYRAKAAWADGLRQLGIVLTPRHTLAPEVPEDLAQVAFWIVKRSVDSKSNHRQFTPVAVYTRGDSLVLGRTPELTEWIPYPELLKKLTGRVSTTTTARAQTETTATFVKNTLYALRGTDTLVITHAQNARYRWPWLLNPGLLEDRIVLGDGPVQRMRARWKRLRVARVATNDRNETPDWWAVPEEEDKPAGMAKGVWLPEDLDPSGRVFYASAQRPDSMQAHTATTKLTPHSIKGRPKEPGEKAPDRNMHQPDAQVGTPQLIELTMAGLCEGDDPETWAMFLQQQRNTEDVSTELVLPFTLHMAALTKEYALPYENVPDDDTVVPTSGPETDEPLQLAPELEIEKSEE